MDEPGQLGGASDIHALQRRAQGSAAGHNEPGRTRAPLEGGEQGLWPSASAGDISWRGFYQEWDGSGMANGYSCGWRERVQKPSTARTQGMEVRRRETLAWMAPAQYIGYRIEADGPLRGTPPPTTRGSWMRMNGPRREDEVMSRIVGAAGAAGDGWPGSNAGIMRNPAQSRNPCRRSYAMTTVLLTTHGA